MVCCTRSAGKFVGDSGSAGLDCKLHICNGHISMNIEGLNTIFGERIANGVLYKISYKKGITLKVLGLMLTADLS